MANIIPFDASAAMPAHIQAAFGELANIAARNTTDQLVFPGKDWYTVLNGEKKLVTRPDKENPGERIGVRIINLVVLNARANRSRAYYGPYVDGENKAPICSSLDGEKPDASIKEPCAPTCASCPNAIKGSKITDDNKATTLCTANKRLAVVPSGDKIGKHPPMLLKLPQTSLWDKEAAKQNAQGWYAWDQYVDFLRQRGVTYTGMVETIVKFDDTPYPKLLFKASRWLDDTESEVTKAVLKEKAEVIDKILNGVPATDGMTGIPTAPAAGGDDDDDDAADSAAREQAAAAAAAEATKQAQAAAKKAEAKAAAQRAAEAAAAAAAEAQRLAAAAAAAAESEGDADWGDTETPAAAAPAPTPAATSKPKATRKPKETAAAAPAPTPEPTVVETASAGDGVSSLLDDWDDETE